MSRSTSGQSSQGDNKDLMSTMQAFMGEITQLVHNSNQNNENNNSSIRLRLPDSYSGVRDANVIDSWIHAVERHRDFHNWDSRKTHQFAITLLSGDADMWYRAIEAGEKEATPNDWLTFKRLLNQAFRPPNTKTLARERLRLCVQTSTIQQYVNDFQNIRLSLPSVTDEEACDKFISGLADDQLVAQLHDIDEEELTLAMAFTHSLGFEAARRPRVMAPQPVNRVVSSFSNAYQSQSSPFYPPPVQHQPSSGNIIDDPMDLDTMQGRFGVGYNAFTCWNCGRPGHIARNCQNQGYSYDYGNLRGGFNARGRGRGNRRGFTRGSNRGSFTRSGNRGGFTGGYNDVRHYSYGRGRGGSGRGQINMIEEGHEQISSRQSSTTNKDAQSGSAYSHVVLHNESNNNIDSVLPYENSELLPNSSKVNSLIPIELTPVVCDSNSIDNTMVQETQDVQHLLQLNNTSTLPVYAVLVGESEFKIHALIDSGATDNYVSRKMVSSLQIDKWERVYPFREVETADGGITRIKDKVTFALSFDGKYHCHVTAYVFPTKFDLILGRTWLKEHNPLPLWESDSYILGKQSDSVQINPVYVINSKAPQLNYLITHKQADRELKKGGSGCLLYIKDVYEGTSSVNGATQQQWIDGLMNDFSGVFQDQLPGLPPERKFQHVIQLENENVKPVNRAPFRMSPAELDELRKQLKELLDLGLIRPSTSPWGSPVLFVRKKDGKSLRMCIDYRALNKLTVKNRTFLPRIDECLDRMQGASYFTCLDLKSGYFQIRLQESDIGYTAFNTRYGKYEWLVLAQGLTNAPPSFQTQMNEILGDCIDNFALCYLDDVCIYSKTWEEHQQHVREVLKRFQEHQFVVNKKKCKFGQRKLVFLGFQVSEKGILPAPGKVEAVLSWPRPKNVQEVRQFVGLAQHYRRFIPGFATIAAPLTDLTRGNGLKRRLIRWNMECETSFNQIKKLLTEAPVLQLPDMNSPYRIETDSSDFAVGAVLLQPDTQNVWHPVAYESKKLSEAERKYPAQERELLAIIHALRTWRCFVDGCPAGYTVVTDHQSLQYLMGQDRPASRLYRWMIELAQFSPEIVYKSGTKHVVPDALSRIGGPLVEPAIKSISPAYVNFVDSLLYDAEGKEKDFEQDWPMFYLKSTEDRKQYLKSNPKILKLLRKEENNIVVRNGQVFHLENCNVGGRASVKEVPYVPFSSRLDLVHEYHQGFGHASTRNLGDLFKYRYWWPTMKRDIGFWISTCPSCQLNINKSTKHHGEMHPLSVPKAFERWHIDFIGELPITQKGNKWIITAVDSLTNWPIARAVPYASAEETADFIYEEIMMRFGCPVEIITDRGSSFKSNLVKAYSARVGVKHKLTSAFHPRTNAKVERFNGIIKPILRKYVNGAIHRWDDFLDTSLWACRIRTHTTTGFSPFYLTYGRDPKIPGDTLRPYIDVETAKDPRTIVDCTSRELEVLGQHRKAAEFRLQAMAEKDKKKWDAAIKPLNFEPGDMVLVTNEGRYGLEPQYKGPYMVVESYPDFGTYKLETLNGKSLDSLIHVDRLKLAQYMESEKPKSAWYEPSSSLRRPTESPTYYSSRPMNKPKVMRGGGISMQLSTNINEIPQTQLSEPVVIISAPSSVSNSDHNLEEIGMQNLMEDIESPVSVQEDLSLMPKEAQVVIKKEVADILTEDIQLPISPQEDVSLMPKETQVVIEKEAVDPLVTNELKKQEIIGDVMFSEPEKCVIYADNVGALEQKDTIDIEMIGEKEQQVIRDTFMIDTEEKKAISIVSSVEEDISKVTTELSQDFVNIAPIKDKNAYSAAMEVESMAKDIEKQELDEHMEEEDIQKDQKIEKFDEITVSHLEEDRIVSKIVEIMKSEKEEQRMKDLEKEKLLNVELEKEKKHIKQLEKEVEKEKHRIMELEKEKQEKQVQEKLSEAAIVTVAGASSSKPLAIMGSSSKQPSTSPTGSNLTEISGVSGVTPISGGENVNIQDVDVPGFVKRLNRNMKRVFKPKKVVERITKRLKAQKD